MSAPGAAAVPTPKGIVAAVRRPRMPAADAATAYLEAVIYPRKWARGKVWQCSHVLVGGESQREAFICLVKEEGPWQAAYHLKVN